MLTLSTLRQSINRWFLCCLTILLPVGMLGMLLMVSLLGPSDHRQIDWTTGAGLYATAKIMLFASALLVPFVFLLNYVARRILCSCPACNKLLYPRAAYKVMAHGKCPVCEASIVKSRDVVDVTA